MILHLFIKRDAHWALVDSGTQAKVFESAAGYLSQGVRVKITPQR
ncbi:hypothetical protein vBAfQDWS535_53 [Alcaligenes phage vB_Af_QDWS535]|nr:hypothetical protein vBAfQDWS535_53 [Alcaligenes phage vB_Af_QDWS535]